MNERTEKMTFSHALHRPAGLARSSRAAHTSFARRMYDTWRQRQVLRDLDIDALNDIGISRKEAQAEARRPIWDAPANWCA
jgi:uncharacterized protein YjiS (DUF1127 family)